MCTITNNGSIAGAEIAPVYINDEISTVLRPTKKLKAFEKCYLQTGEAKVISFKLTTRYLAFYNIATKAWKVEPGKFNILIGA